ncbi:MAG: lysylphosphatidylglycerol synthase transmembrane domain-containing protein, partial [Acidimicrobiia bacterium]
MLAAVGHNIPLKPAMILQSAIKFISLAVPSSAGRIGMTAAFLRKYGVGLTTSLVQGSIDTVAGLIVEIIVLVSAVVFGGVSFGLTSDETEWGVVLLVVLLVGVVAVVLVRRIKKLRDWLLPILGEAFGGLGQVVKDPKRALGVLISNFGSRFVLALSMWLILSSMDVSLGIWTVLTATVATGLLAGIIPVPGGIGVAEAVLTGSLVLFGVDETTAFAAAVVYRVATFYIPSAAGFFSMRWLEKHGYV